MRVLVSVTERYWKAIDIRVFRVIHQSQRYDDYAPSEIRKIQNKIGVQMKDQVLIGKDSSLLIKFLTKFKRLCDSSRIQEGVSIWHFPKFMNCLYLATLNGGCSCLLTLETGMQSSSKPISKCRSTYYRVTPLTLLS